MSLPWPGRHGPAIDYISEPPAPRITQKRPRSIAILGSTGSVGQSAMSILERHADFFKVAALAGATSISLLAYQANRWRPPMLGVLDETHARAISPMLHYRPKIVYGPAGYGELASSDTTDWVLSAQVGAAGLAATLAAALAGKVIALANKESLVLAGDLLRFICARTGSVILPVDSEHQAIFQCVSGRGQTVRNLVLTASGGPFRGKTTSQLQNVTVEEALNHPNWSMGAKITIDSATLMNKGLEFIEAMHLYGISPDRIDILVHPQSVIHSLAVFQDNSLLAQLAVPDMSLPIALCLMWPHCPANIVAPVDLAQIGNLSFSRPDQETFRCLKLALEAARYTPDAAWQALRLNPACIALNAANEAAVMLFLKKRCQFSRIPDLIHMALQDSFTLTPPQAVPPQSDLFAHVQQLDRIIGDINQRYRQFVLDRVSQ